MFGNVSHNPLKASELFRKRWLTGSIGLAYPASSVVLHPAATAPSEAFTCRGQGLNETSWDVEGFQKGIDRALGIPKLDC